MIVSVYGVDEAFVVVRLNAGSVDDGITAGNSARNRLGHRQPDRERRREERHAFALDLRGPPARPARPRRPAPPPRSRACRRGSRSPRAGRPRPRRPSTSPTGSVSLRARSRISPSVLSVRNSSPWVDEQQERRQAAQEPERVEQREQAARVLLVRVDRHAGDDVGEGDAPQQRRQEAADRDHGVHAPAPGEVAALVAVLDPDAAHDERRRGSGTARGRSPRTAWRTTRGRPRTVAPPATRTQTSLPSQTGPIVADHRPALGLVPADRGAGGCRRRSRSPRG